MLLRATLEAPEYAAEVAELPRRQQLTYATRAASVGSCQRIADRADLLAQQAHVVGVGEHLLEDVPAFIDAGGPGQRLHVPERVQVERALAGG
jgi:hypothetical protein